MIKITYVASMVSLCFDSAWIYPKNIMWQNQPTHFIIQPIKLCKEKLIVENTFNNN
jgi:hypothetical protein